MEDKQTKRGPGRPRTRTMEEFWEKQREWTKSYYDRNRDKVCIKQQIRYYNNKLRDALDVDKVNKGDIARLEAKISELEAKLAELEKKLFGDTSTDAKLVCRLPLALNGDILTSLCTPFSVFA